MRFVIPDLLFPNEHPKAIRRAVAQRREAVWRAWREHNDALRPLLSPTLVWLLDFSLDDALTRYLHIDPHAQTLSLGLLVGDLQRGYFEADLHYHGITLSPQETQLLCLTVADETNDLHWGELEREETANGVVYTHRLCWHTQIHTFTYLRQGQVAAWECLAPEVALRFTNFALELSPRKSRKLRKPAERIHIARDPRALEELMAQL